LSSAVEMVTRRGSFKLHVRLFDSAGDEEDSSHGLLTC